MGRGQGYDLTQATVRTPTTSDHFLYVSGGAIYKGLISALQTVITATFTLTEKVQTKTAAYTITSDDNIINADTDTAGGVIALSMDNAANFWDSATSRTKVVTVNNIGATYSTTVTPYGAQTIQGASSLTISAGSSASIYTDGSNLFTRGA